MSHMPSHGNAANTRAGNARENFQMQQQPMRENFSPEMMGMGMQCAFPSQTFARRCYCQPAPFSSLDGRSYSRLINAYGMSRPCGPM